VATRPWRDSLPEEAVVAVVVVAHGKHYIVYLSVLITVDNIGLHCMYRVQGYGFQIPVPSPFVIVTGWRS